MFMQSSGGLTDARLFQGKDSILSGPAGGVVGAVRTSLAAGFDRVIGFDMGGTSTDVSHFNGQFERVFETLVAGVRMRAPMMSIHTVAAGGGSILHFDGARYRVGPDSAGAQPGPACYRAGGPLTVTDANVMLGKIQPEFFPRVFGPRGDEALDAAVVRDEVRGARRGDPREDRRRAAAGSGRRRLRAHRGREHGERHQEDLGRARPRRHRAIRCAASAAPPASTPAWSPTRSPSRGSSSIPTPACCPPTAWGSPTSPPCAATRSRRGWNPTLVPRLDETARAACRRSGAGGGGPGRAAGNDPGRRPRAPALRGHRYRRAGGLRHARGNAGATSRRATGSSSAFSCPGAPWWSKPCRSRRPRPGESIDEAQPQPQRLAGRRGSPGRCACTAAAPCTTRRCTAARRCAPATPSPARRSSPRANATTVVEPQWQAQVTTLEPPRALARVAAPAARGHRHAGGPGDAGDLQQPLHGDRGADGRDARPHRLLGQHQGAARFLLRAVRRGGRPDRQRAAPAGPPGRHGRERARGRHARTRGGCARATSTC